MKKDKKAQTAVIQPQKEPKWKRIERYQWNAGQSGNPKGRPKGQSLKEWVREYLQSLDPKEKKKFMKHVDPDMAWKMAEGLPHQTTDVTSGGKPIPIYGAVSRHNSDKEDIPVEQKD